MHVLRSSFVATGLSATSERMPRYPTPTPCRHETCERQDRAALAERFHTIDRAPAGHGRPARAFAISGNDAESRYTATAQEGAGTESSGRGAVLARPLPARS